MNVSEQRAVPTHLSVLAAAVALTACGGGGSDDASAPPPPPPPAVQSVQGTAAVGAALAKANVSITDASGAAVCQEATIVTSDTGSYACTLQAGKTAPFVVVVTDPAGRVAPLVSVATTTPVAGTPLVVNATPFTTAILAQVSPDKNALTFASQLSALDTAALQSATTKVLAQLADVLSGIGAPAGYNPFSTPITAATATVAGNTADQVIDVLKFSSVNGQLQVSTVDNPSAAVPLADASTATVTKLPPPASGVVTLTESLKRIATQLQKCFSLDVAQRVLAKDTTIPATQGGPEVTEAAAECNGIVTDDYLNNGYSSGQEFYGLLTDGNMTGASFEVPELMRFFDDTSAADDDRALVNIRYTDKNGVVGNIISVARRQGGSGPSWLLWGNRQPVESSVRAVLRRREQLAPNPGTPPFANAANSRYEIGLDFFVNKDGPGSAGMRAVRVKGPGLPTAGLVFTRPDPTLALSQNWLNIRRKDGNTDPAAATFAGNVGNIFLMQRTVGLTGADATTVRPVPNQGNGNNTQFVNWAHPLDYGQPAGTASFIDFSQLKPMTSYAFEVFYDGETTPRHSFNKTLLTAVVPATRAASLQWNDLGASTKAYLDPSNALTASTASIEIGWTANPYAETIRSAGVYTGDASGPVNQGLVSVARGATSATANAPVVNGSTVPFPTLTNDGVSYRQIQLRYRMLDGSYKDTITQFN